MKYYGTVAYGISEETKPGVWEKRIVEKQYYGDVIENNRRLQSLDEINDNHYLHGDITVSNQISIVADPYAYEHFYAILYIEYMGVKWKVSNVRVAYPRLILHLGEVYNVVEN